jgi:hypothetical protein
MDAWTALGHYQWSSHLGKEWLSHDRQYALDGSRHSCHARM